MTRLMYDSVTAAHIPADAAIVAGYVNGVYQWSPADWARFPNAVHVGISITALADQGDVLDVESGDATPQQAPGWVELRRRAGLEQPCVYMNAYTWPMVRQAFADAGVPPPYYWVAEWDGDPSIPLGAEAHQYLTSPQSGGHYDLSSCSELWPTPTVTPGPPPQPQQPYAEDDMSLLLVNVVTNGASAGTFVLETANGVHCKLEQLPNQWPGPIVTMDSPTFNGLVAQASGQQKP